MANVRSINKDKYNISNYRFRELYYFCLQYSEWKAALKELRNPLKGTQISAVPASGDPGNPTMKNALKCAELTYKCELIETAAKMADPELYEYIIYAVTNEDISFNILKIQKDIPCERDRYYDRRRKFYFVLDKLLRKKGAEELEGI